ncbi:AsnC family transcriptional regulator [Halorarum halophilum]|uniref:AsnC family transcriptional regulator n=1 Tax=Halorarum halophilum TaxID=2743090 RepID=A0A7D5GMV0_9EURY|nr:AsnC family transcriptional regulator [Halobaculum halophilum]QLG29027.1 AsnC family transcriptional regulator [Halobaculum halophilum]
MAGLDQVDRGILYLLQRDARNSTTAGIGEALGVSSTTVGNRINNLENENVITGYLPTVDYERMGLDHHLLVVATVPFGDRERLADEALEVRGVVNVRELLTHRRNLTVELVGTARSDVEAALTELGELGLEIASVDMLKRELDQPVDHFGSDVVDGN